MMSRIICLIIGYLFGTFQTSYFIGRARGLDIREFGSGNAGTTNAMRVLGKKSGWITVIIDILKCIIAVIITWLIFRKSGYVPLLKIYTSLGAVLGHDFPAFLKFRGGKGIATTAGMIIAFGDWRLIVLGVACFFIPVLITHHVSVGSLCLSVSFLVGTILCGQLGSYGMPQNLLTEMYILIAAITALAFFQHRGNLKRLAEGTERTVWVRKK
ncbi:MAG: glycerol-3-phosphate 1-O-acyltransferase PlsY [Lachnospiraceae bacterium]|nr:glycerol-3-phosphate 1-O-acyltransferase PlsY [Lachnospiraceae bacterium]